MVSYRKVLALSLVTKAFICISEKLQDYLINMDVSKTELCGGKGILNLEQKSAQYFTVVPGIQEKFDAVARPIVHTSAYKQATGEAVYCDDIPSFENELHLAFVTSARAHAKIVSLDFSAALEVEGVEGFVGIEDIDIANNTWGPIVHDEKVFYHDEVTSQGQIIAAVVAKDPITAQKAAKLVNIEYDDITPMIISIEDAIAKQSFFSNPHRKIETGGDLAKIFKEAPHVLQSQCRIGGQEHFYFETQCVIVVPKTEDQEMEIFASTQNPTEIQHLVGHVLGIQQNKITCHVKRIGGGFGGKETKASIVALPTAIAARKFNRPIRCMLDRDQDMILTAGRHPCLGKYKVAFDREGKILGCEVEIYLNGGHSHDLSLGVCDRAMTHFENAYFIPACKATGWICKTNLPSNTAFRGFGAPQGMFIAENIIQDIAEFLGLERENVSQVNLYKTGQLTPYNQILENCPLDACWQECLKLSNFDKRKNDIELYNRQYRYKKRGISLIPTKFGIAFGVPFLNQGGALVNIYADGSVLLHHGGIEMGQGLYTKMIQITSRALGISTDKIHTGKTNIEVVPNTSPTAASTGSDLNGMAILNACNILNDRLQPYKAENPGGQWEDWVKAAYFNRVSLSAQGYYKMPDIGHNWEKNEGNMFGYFTYGVACSEVEIDILTGDHKVLRTDIVMDVGESLNPAIDIGQIEGAFMQGYGLFALEELVYSSAGALFTRGPGTYKIPSFGDIPDEFFVSLLKGSSNPRAVYSSKGVGEPPLFLASSVLFAIKAAIYAARLEAGILDKFKLDAPATAEKIRMACQDNITSKVKEPQSGTFKPWNIQA